MHANMFLFLKNKYFYEGVKVVSTISQGLGVHDNTTMLMLILCFTKYILTNAKDKRESVKVLNYFLSQNQDFEN